MQLHGCHASSFNRRFTAQTGARTLAHRTIATDYRSLYRYQITASCYYVRVMVFRVITPFLLIKALDGGEESGQFHTPAALTTGKRAHGSHCIWGCVGPRTSLGALERRKMSCPAGVSVQLLGNGLDGPGFESRQGQVNLLQNVQTNSGVHPVSYSMGTQFLPGEKEAGS